MICPKCGAHAEDGSTACPDCHAALADSLAARPARRHYCASCGTLIPDDAAVCPSCGLPVSSNDDTDGAEGEEGKESPRIESALPTATGPYSATSANERMPRRRVFILAFAAALVVVGGTILAISQPWNPTVYDQKTQIGVDTSKAGYPGEKKKLAGQDKGIDTTVPDGAAIQYQQVSDCYEQLKELRGKLQKSQEALLKDVDDPSADRAADYEEAKQNALDLSNLIAKIGSIDTSSGLYAEEAGHLSTLGSWLRNWSDSLVASWKLAQDAKRDPKAVLAPLAAEQNSDGISSYAALFDQNFKDWQPQQK